MTGGICSSFAEQGKTTADQRPSSLIQLHPMTLVYLVYLYVKINETLANIKYQISNIKYQISNIKYQIIILYYIILYYIKFIL